jgi:hypothetical protein
MPYDDVITSTVRSSPVPISLRCGSAQRMTLRTGFKSGGAFAAPDHERDSRNRFSDREVRRERRHLVE